MTSRRTARGPALARRSLLAGAGLGALSLAACTEDPPEGIQSPPEEDAPEDGGATEDEGAPVVELVEYSGTSRGPTVWAVRYDLPEDAEAPPLYSAATQAARHEALQAKKAEQEWTLEDPLLVLDPYGTTRTGLYVHFTGAEEGGTLTATATAAATPDFTRAIVDHGEDGAFEALVVALIPAAHNELVLQWTADGAAPREITSALRSPVTAADYSSQLAAEVPDPGAISPGLFALSGVSSHTNNTFLYDEHGAMRGEIASTDHPSHHLVVEDGRIVTTTGARQISVIDHFGHAGTIIDLGEHLAHHDLEVDGDAVYVLTSRDGEDQVMDRVARVDLASGAVEETVNLTELLSAYHELTHEQEEVGGGSTAEGKDWIHLNSVDVTDGVMYVSARETSTVIALDGALSADEETTVRWMIGVEGLWEGTGHEEQFLAPEGSPTVNAGQHSAIRIDDEALPEGQYYLEMFNNNYWHLSTRDTEDWEGLQPEGTSMSEKNGVSHALRYLVDENAGTFTEADRVDLAYSSVVSNVQRLGEGTIADPFVANAGMSAVFTEHAADGTVLGTYRYDAPSMAYRVYKDSFEGFWYQPQ
ncbi:aryl-sulfate sulfotransferase [Brachybacterium sp. YJGR34]|uniref:aryl-sulfate sulfotransferase n=1 Tax=Brachybacterium sp. YJGR34 TaxID=2059911 RepID=UPI001300576F|nr:aryl-sulfate sulfotransferase [Brachybacterium sp. YJGR34]